jgi:predicted ATPase
MPFLNYISTIDAELPNEYPFNIATFANGIHVKLTSNVTFLVGENGSGKSTLLEAIANKVGFNLSGGNKNHQYEFHNTESQLARYLRLSWTTKQYQGFFMRAESFFNFATFIDKVADEDGDGIYDTYGGKSLHNQSHGEAFLSLFYNKFDEGIYLLDEPEAALSPQRLLAFLSIINEIDKTGQAQFIIATHSPILLSYPNAVILDMDNNLQPIAYKETNHYTLTRDFLNDPERYLHHLLGT